MKKAIAFLLIAAFLFVAVTTPLTRRKFVSGPIRVTDRQSLLELLLSTLAVHASNSETRVSLGEQRWDNVLGVWPCVAKVENSDWWAFSLRGQFGEATVFVVNSNGAVVVQVSDHLAGGMASSVGMTNDPHLRLIKASDNTLVCVRRELSARGEVVFPAKTNEVPIPAPR